MKKLKLGLIGGAAALAAVAFCAGENVMAAPIEAVQVVLDAGHDSTHAGARRGDLREEYINMGIVLACEQELEKYEGIEIDLTRGSMGCPSAGSSSANCMINRVKYAASKDADVFISFHVDATAGYTTSARGAMVMYTGYSKYRSRMRELSNSILSELGKLGLRNRGTIINNDDHNSGRYDDGTWKDDLSVIRNSVLLGFPGILVEHGFINNEMDNINFRTDENISAVGRADGRGIANYYGLKKVSDMGRPEIQTIKTVNSNKVMLTWKGVKEAQSYNIYRSNAKAGEYKLVAQGLGTCEYTDTEVKSNRWYYYRVQAVNGEDSNYGRPLGTKSLGIPKVSVRGQDEESIMVSWNKITSAAGYVIRRSITKSGGYRIVGTITSGSKTTFCDGNVQQGATYYYQAAAYKKLAGTRYIGSYCLGVGGVTLEEAVAVDVMNLPESNRITWSRAENAAGYTIWRSKEEEGEYLEIGRVDASVLQFEDREIEEGVQYYYKVRVFRNK